MTAARETISVRTTRRLTLLKLILDHPLNRGRPAQAVGRWAGWQVWRRIVRRPITARIWDGVRVRVYPDWPYSWTAIYLKLAEYDDMMFTLRYLRPGDAFVDVGANVGFYSLLASSVNGGAPVLALEPHPLASRRLRENALLNSFDNVRVRAVAAGSHKGSARLTADLVDQNRISESPEDSGSTLSVPVVTLDAELATQGIDDVDVCIVKIDTEGFESNVLSGAQRLLETQPGPVWMVEVAGLGLRYGSNDSELLAMFRDRGYEAFIYTASNNRLVRSDGPASGRGNVIFTRDPESVSLRLVRTTL
jgi:FkbM family methyltransferase